MLSGMCLDSLKAIEAIINVVDPDFRGVPGPSEPRPRPGRE